MTDLSPIAHEILMAQAKVKCVREWSNVNDPPCHPSDPGWQGCYTCIDRAAAAATLRAAADQVVPAEDEDVYIFPWKLTERMYQRQETRRKFLSVIKELEG